MALPAGISTALVHLDAPVSFIGDPGQLHVTIKSSVPLVWAETGTPLANFIDNINPGEGTELSVELPHTDQDGFLDGNGNTFTGWSYVVEIVYEKSGEQVHFPTREFQILTGQDSVDLALVPAGESYVPVVAPILPVTSLEGFTGAVTLTQLALDLVDNTPDLAKPVSTATQTALNGKSNVGHLHNAADLTDGLLPDGRLREGLRVYPAALPGADWNLAISTGWFMAFDALNAPQAGVWFMGEVVAHNPIYATQTVWNFTGDGSGNTQTFRRGNKNGVWGAWYKLQIAQAEQDARYLKLADSTDQAIGSTVVVRDAAGDFSVRNVFATVAPTNVGHLTRKDYVDNKVAAVTYATLGIVPTSSLPPLAISEPFVVASQTAMLALVAQRGDVAIRTDIGRSYILASDSPATLADWKLLTAAGDVVSVAGRTGSVVLAKADVGLTNVDNTSDAAKPVSTAQQTALNLKANAANPAFTGTPTGLAKAHVGLANVDNTSDAAKPVSTAQAALFVPRWKAATVYAAGDQVVTPRNTVVKSKTARTSGAAYDTAEAVNWAGEDQVMVFSNGGFGWGSNAAWDAGPLAPDASSGASSQVSPGAAFCTAGGLSGTLKFTEPGLYDVIWDCAPQSEPGNAGYRIVTTGAWPGTPDAPNTILGMGIHMNGQTYYETKVLAMGIRVPQANLEIRLTGIQINATTNIPRVKVIKRAEI